VANPVIARGGSRHLDTPVSTVVETEDPSVGLRSSSALEANAAWRALYDEQFVRVYRLVCRFGVATADAEDVTQQVFVTAYRRIQEVDEVHSVPGWLRGIATRVTSEYHRWWRVRRVKQWVVEAVGGARGAGHAPPDRATEAAQTQARVAAVLRRMTPKLRAVLVLCDIDECSASEAADALDIPVNTVRSRRRLAREAFQELWEKHPEEAP
jgi:RNA polymerase sigma-70 factor (ECF subfamily)